MINDMTTLEICDNLASELRRGSLVLAVLGQCTEAQYGYSLKQRLEVAGLVVNEGTLYPLLRRLEGQGLLTSAWQLNDAERPRRYYQLSASGAEVRAQLAVEWGQLVAILARLQPENKQGSGL